MMIEGSVFAFVMAKLTCYLHTRRARTSSSNFTSFMEMSPLRRAPPVTPPPALAFQWTPYTSPPSSHRNTRVERGVQYALSDQNKETNDLVIGKNDFSGRPPLVSMKPLPPALPDIHTLVIPMVTPNLDDTRFHVYHRGLYHHHYTPWYDPLHPQGAKYALHKHQSWKAQLCLACDGEGGGGYVNVSSFLQKYEC